jgi:hypothetical protein
MCPASAETQLFPTRPPRNSAKRKSNGLGNLYYKNEAYGMAERYWRRDANSSVASRFNLWLFCSTILTQCRVRRIDRHLARGAEEFAGQQAYQEIPCQCITQCSQASSGGGQELWANLAPAEAVVSQLNQPHSAVWSGS